MPSELVFVVVGQPVPQGSKKAFVMNGRAVMVDDNKKGLKTWRKLVNRKAAVAVRGMRPADKADALALSLDFRLERGKSVKRQHATVAPDLDKLTRAVKDALTGVVYVDDSQVVEYYAPYCKRYCAPGESPGVTIRVRRVSAAQHDFTKG